MVRDERTAAVENAAFKWGYYILYFGLLLDCLYRHRVRHEDIGDLFVVLGGKCSLHQCVSDQPQGRGTADVAEVSYCLCFWLGMGNAVLCAVVSVPAHILAILLSPVTVIRCSRSPLASAALLVYTTPL